MIQSHLPVRLPCYDFTPVTSPAFGIPLLAVKVTTSGMTSSHSVTGSVYKARERIHRRKQKQITEAALSFAVHRGAVTLKVFANGPNLSPGFWYAYSNIGVRASRHGALIVINSAVVLLGSTKKAREINLLRPTPVEANVGNPDSRLARRSFPSFRSMTGLPLDISSESKPTDPIGD
ncbi:hypothetical protein GW17_00001371 [Ensete ventricosum]|nr:hypothetical protein GW17_00001371 [Ensete ventricosum]